jgi:hypothetical protein
MKRWLVLALGLFVTVSVAYAQSGAGAGAASADAGMGSGKGRALLKEMVEALGGQKWLDMRNEYNEGRVAGYFQGRPDDVLSLFFDWREPLGPERVELTKKRNVVELYHGDQCTEVDYKGAHPQMKKNCERYQRRRKHSIEYAVRVWLKEPGTMVMYDGQKLSNNHLVDQVTLMNADNDTITILLDDDSHLPMEVRYEWRDPVYHDMDKDVVQFSNYRRVDGIATPFTITYFHNGLMTEQKFVYFARYNVELPRDGFSVEKTLDRIVGKRRKK